MGVGALVARHRRPLAGSVAGLAVLMLFAAPDASAHAVLESSTPTAGTVLREQPDRVELRFDEPVEAALGAIKVVGGDGSRVDTATVTRPGSAARVAVGLRTRLSEGSYLVVWRVVSADSHPVHGSFTFAIGHPGVVAGAPTTQSAQSLAVGLGVARFAGYGGLLLLVGALVFLTVCAPGLRADRAARRLIATAVGFAAAGTVAGFALQGAFDVGGGWSRVLDPVTLRALLDTRLGHSHALRLALLVVLWLLVRRGAPASRGQQGLVAVTLLGMLTSVAAEGHSGRTLTSAALDVAHLSAAGAWLGGLVALALVALPAQRRRAHRQVAMPPLGVGASPGDSQVAVLERVAVTTDSWLPVRRFSAVALASVCVLAGTGVAQALRQVPEWGALTGTTYGRLILVKIGLVAVTLAVASVSRQTVHRRLATRSDDQRGWLLTRTVAVESVLLGVVLVVTSVLVATTPAKAAYRPIQERQVQTGPVTLDVTALNPSARTLELHFYCYGADGLPVAVDDLRAEAAQQSGASGLGPVAVPLLQAGTGHYLAGQLLLPHAGRWSLTLVVRVGEFDAYTATTSLQVR
jgi:copper transport protein